MKKISLLLLVCSALVFTGCTTDDCEITTAHDWCLPKVLNQYLPYEVGQQISFYNDRPESLADTLVYEVRDMYLLNYDTAYYTYYWDLCHPGYDLPVYYVRLSRISGQSSDEVPDEFRLLFYGTAGGENGQRVSIRFGFEAHYNNAHVNLTSQPYDGDISDLGDAIDFGVVGDNSLSAQIVKDKGLTSFSNKGNSSANWLWHLVE